MVIFQLILTLKILNYKFVFNCSLMNINIFSEGSLNEIIVAIIIILRLNFQKVFFLRNESLQPIELECEGGVDRPIRMQSERDSNKPDFANLSTKDKALKVSSMYYKLSAAYCWLLPACDC